MAQARGDAGLTEPIFFDGPEHFREWLEAHHETETEVSVGFYKKATGKQTMSWPQAVDQALCFGWIDGKVNRIDAERHRQRFTPRKPDSNWSKVNVEKMAKLEEEGLMTDAGRRAFESRTEGKTGVYSFEQARPAELPEEYLRQLRANAEATDFFFTQPPWYRRAASWWVVSAKREETRARRLATLIEDSENGRTIKQLTRPGGRAGAAKA